MKMITYDESQQSSTAHRSPMPNAWDDEEVAARWNRLTRTLDGPVDAENAAMREQSLLQQPERLAEIRARLGSLSWFMRFLNEAIARAANAEDQCTGRFWEGRFKCQALLDDAAVLAVHGLCGSEPDPSRLVRSPDR